MTFDGTTHPFVRIPLTDTILAADNLRQEMRECAACLLSNPWSRSPECERMDTNDTPRRRATPGGPGWPQRCFIAALTAPAPGCTSQRLQINTVSQAKTVGDLQYQQVLDNLAMFRLNPAALPSLVSLKTGASQVGDTGSLGFLGVAGLDSKFGSSPTVSGTRTVVDQWGSSPVTDDNNLLLVRKAFRSALGYHDLIDEDDANDLAHDLSSQIGTTADMSVDNDTIGRIYSQSVVSDLAAKSLAAVKKQRHEAPMPDVEVMPGVQFGDGKKGTEIIICK
jgi:hypothetical protein